MLPLTFAVLRRLTHEEFRSGEAIARELGISRASVCNALCAVARLGVEIHRVRGRGYRLGQPLDWIDAEALSAQLGNRFSVSVQEVVESTNTTLATEAAQGAPHRSCLVAEWQQAGRGRRGRRWESALGGSLTFSLLWRFPQGVSQLSGLSLAVGLALRRAMLALGLADTALKWPNDLVHGYRKLGGILVELQGDALGPTAAVIGVGINVRLGPLKDRIDQAVTDLGALLPDMPSRTEMLVCLLRHLDAVLSCFEVGGFGPLREEWQAAHAYQGRPVALLLPSGARVEGRVVGVAEDGALLLSTARGEERFASGEISLRPARSIASAA
ncbi:biotin--[acetyl-CoA-carboxylase] ligase [Thiobacter aerophilum]|uniref:Bifunctional ligase/repressor BirA n=1 Tax=Thiobacter aerophilum TaxID=3121275 RepID=A0ABV0EIZ6_9BURK